MLPRNVGAIYVRMATQNSAVANGAGWRIGRDTGITNELMCNPVVNNMEHSVNGRIRVKSDGTVYQTINAAGDTLINAILDVFAVELL